MFFLIPKVFRQRISMSLLSNGIEFKIKMKYLVLHLQAHMVIKGHFSFSANLCTQVKLKYFSQIFNA